LATQSSLQKFLKQAVRVAVIFFGAYIVLINLALQLPLTQTLVNTIRPEKFHVSWERAWTWYPFRVNASGISANGQSRSQQWQVYASSASASINPIPLVLKRVWLSNVSAENIQYRQRPRFKPDKDYAAIMPFFPDIEGREIVPADTSPRRKKRPWRISVDGIEARGEHSFWVMQFRGSGTGTLKADFTYESRGGPFSLENGHANISLEPLYVSGDNEVFNRGTVQGTVALAPFVPRESKGLVFLSYLSTDAEVDFDVNSLAFISVLTRDFKQMTFDGKGQVEGRIVAESGQLLTETDFAVQASDLLVDVMGHRILGLGEVTIGPSGKVPGWLDLKVRFTHPSVTHVGDQDPLLVGETLRLGLTGSGDLTGNADPTDDRRSLSFHIDDLLAPDLSLFEHYLPAKWPIRLIGGEGRVNGTALIAASALDIGVSLKSEDAELGAAEYRFTSDLEAALNVSNPSTGSSDTMIGGSYIKLSDARLSDRDDASVKPWEASFTINDGGLSLLPDEAKGHDDGVRDLLQVIGETDSKALLNNLRGFVDFESRVSSLAWIGVFLDDSYGTALRGRGELGGRFQLAAGMPAAGTDIEILSDELSLDILDYTGRGDGRIRLVVQDGDKDPDWLLRILLADGQMNRKGEDVAYIEDVKLSLAALIEDVSLERENTARTLALNIDSARVTDLSAFNSYLPPDAPVQLSGGTASLASAIVLQPTDADGWLTLTSNDMEFLLDGQSLRADLALDLKVVDGIPRDMTFDLTGSSVELARVSVKGAETSFDDDGWSAAIQLTEADTTWQKPLRLDASANLTIADSRPVVALLSNRGDSPGWLLEMITIEDIAGKADLEIADNQIVIPLAHAISDKIELGAKGTINPQTRNGIIYARYKKLDAVMKIEDGERNIDVIRAREKYQQYQAVTPSSGGS
jgi:hypothetical protein